MEKLPMCRICLVENVQMFVVLNRSLHELYEKLTDIPFITEDRRPILACFICYTKLKQCCRLLRKCLEAEERFAQMMNEDYKPSPLINEDRLEFYSGFIKSPIEHISIVDECQTESIAIKEELPAVCEGLDDVIEPKKEYQSDELEPENLDNSCLDVADLPPHCSESEFIYDVPLIVFKTEVQGEEVSKKIERVGETEKLEPEKIDNNCLDVADIPPHWSESELEDDVPLMEFKTEVNEVSKEIERVGETESATVVKKTKLEDAITAEQTKKENSDSKVIRPTQKRTSKLGTHYEEPYKCDEHNGSNVKKKLKIFTHGGIRKRQDHDERTDLSDNCMNQNDIDEIKKRRSAQNKIRCRRYRENKKKTEAIVSSQTKHRTAEEEEIIKRRKEYDKQKSQRYRDKKRANTLINLRTK